MVQPSQEKKGKDPASLTPEPWRSRLDQILNLLNDPLALLGTGRGTLGAVG